MKTTPRFLISTLALLTAAHLSIACGGSQKDPEMADGPVEEAGEAVDEAAEDTAEAAEDAANETEEALDDAE